MNKKTFGIIFPIFFIIVLASGIEQIKWVSYSTPIFYFYFMIVGYKELKNKELWFTLLFVGLFGVWADRKSVV